MTTTHELPDHTAAASDRVLPVLAVDLVTDPALLGGLSTWPAAWRTPASVP
ncbi:hypothetical protein [Brachybacterium sp. Z12]|uniref:hypothetical protein n=1 Tax=Brachybacterium sp. Z12 TaxID=2759167 RepID=UPI00223C201D|nr:hypothetical protein [Brachybacterium sp. Z12]